MKQSAMQISLAVIFGASTFCAQAATLNTGDVLTITAATLDDNSQVISGSYYGTDFNNDLKIINQEKTQLSQGTTGLVIGVITTPGAFHSGSPDVSDTNAITAPDVFMGNTGSWYSTNPITGGTTTGLNMSGWNWAWNGLASIPLGSNAWQPANCAALGCSGHTFTNGIGLFQWDGIYGHVYTLDFTSRVAAGDLSGFGDVRFYTHLEGTVNAVPVPAAAWLLGSGLLGLIGVSRRRRK